MRRSCNELMFYVLSVSGQVLLVASPLQARRKKDHADVENEIQEVLRKLLPAAIAELRQADARASQRAAKRAWYGVGKIIIKQCFWQNIVTFTKW